MTKTTYILLLFLALAIGFYLGCCKQSWVDAGSIRDETAAVTQLQHLCDGKHADAVYTYPTLHATVTCYNP